MKSGVNKAQGFIILPQRGEMARSINEQYWILEMIAKAPSRFANFILRRCKCCLPRIYFP